MLFVFRQLGNMPESLSALFPKETAHRDNGVPSAIVVKNIVLRVRRTVGLCTELLC